MLNAYSQKQTKQGPTPKRNRLYDELRLQAEELFKGYALLYVMGEINLSVFHMLMQQTVKEQHLDVALLGKGGRKLTIRDKRDLEVYIGEAFEFVDGFITDITAGEVSDEGIVRRAGRYSYLWDRYARFTIPAELFDLLPAHPGEDCLGGAACGCYIGWEKVDDEIHVYWYIDPSKEHCAFCLLFFSEWQPLIIPMGELEEEVDFDYEEEF